MGSHVAGHRRRFHRENGAPTQKSPVLAEEIFGDVRSRDGDVIARRLGAHQTPLGKLSIPYTIAIVIAAVFVAKTGAKVKIASFG
jgi:hypothetical protein